MMDVWLSRGTVGDCGTAFDHSGRAVFAKLGKSMRIRQGRMAVVTVLDGGGTHDVGSVMVGAGVAGARSRGYM